MVTQQMMHNTKIRGTILQSYQFRGILIKAKKGFMFCQTNLAFEQTTVPRHNACSLFLGPQCMVLATQVIWG
jgi:hypothetical protein